MGRVEQLIQEAEECNDDELLDVYEGITKIFWKRLRTFNSSPSKERRFLAIFLQCYASLTQSNTAGRPIRSVLRHSTDLETVLDAIIVIENWYVKCTREPLTKRDREVLYKFCAEMTIQAVLDSGRDISLNRCFYWLKRVPELFEQNFPGYIQANMVKEIVGRRV